jgi:hypothetical protein
MKTIRALAIPLALLAGCTRYERWYDPPGIVCPLGTDFRHSNAGAPTPPIWGIGGSGAG